MDQPKNEHEENSSEQNMPENTDNQEATTQDGIDNTPYQDETPAESTNDPLEGLQPSESTSVEMPESMPEPTATEVSPEQHEQAVAEAEEHVAEAAPQAASDELADVASELQAMEGQNFDGEASSEPTSGIYGTDPMKQIEQDEVAASQTQPSPDAEPADKLPVDGVVSEPAPESGSEPIVGSQPAPLEEEPASSDENLSESEVAGESTPAVLPESQSGQMISDVIAPNPTSVAAAAGTLGANAITGTPETTSTDAANVAGSTPKPAKPKSKKGVLILIVILVTLLFGGAAVAAYMTSTKKTDDNTSAQDTSADQTSMIAENSSDEAATLATASPGEDVQAATLDDFKVACGAGKVLNADEYSGGPSHPIVMFEKGSDDKYAQSIQAFKDKTWQPNANDLTTTQLVGCIAMAKDSSKKIKSCPITDPATKVTVNVDYLSSTYNVAIHEARTGIKSGSFDVASVSTDCPTTASYDKADPKIYAEYDLAALETSLKEYVGKIVPTLNNNR